MKWDVWYLTMCQELFYVFQINKHIYTPQTSKVIHPTAVPVSEKKKQKTLSPLAC